MALSFEPRGWKSTELNVNVILQPTYKSHAIVWSSNNETYLKNFFKNYYVRWKLAKEDNIDQSLWEYIKRVKFDKLEENEEIIEFGGDGNEENANSTEGFCYYFEVKNLR